MCRAPVGLQCNTTVVGWLTVQYSLEQECDVGILYIEKESSAHKCTAHQFMSFFFSIYVISFIILLLGLVITGLDFESSFSAIGACLNNLGPGLGEVSQTYASISPAGKGILSFAMILGRLEIFTLLVLFTPVFWRV